MTIFTAAQRRSLQRLSGNYLHLNADESDFTLSDVFSLGLLLTKETQKKDRNPSLILYYKSCYTSLCGALKIPNPEMFLIRLASLSPDSVWNDFSDFNAVWYPKWFQNQLYLREKLFSFSDEEEQKIRPDFWGATSSDDHLKHDLLHVRDSFTQIRVGVLALVFKIDAAIASLLAWDSYKGMVSWGDLKSKFSYPQGASEDR
jgi:hypothetical protein